MERSQRNKRKQTRVKQITVIVLLAMVVFFGILNLVFGDRSAKRPKLSATSVLNGQYMEEYEDYLSEKFVGEDLFSSAAGSLQAMFGRREFNGIYRGEDHYLARAISEPNEKEIRKSIEEIGELCSGNYNTSVYVMLVPDAADIYADRFPEAVTRQNQTGQFEQIRKLCDPAVNWVDVRKTLNAHKGEDIYYRTDERWTSLGAKYGYEALAEAMNLDTSIAPKMRAYAVNNDFSGPLARESGYEQNYEETISIYSAKNVADNVSVLVENADTGKKSATLYDSAKLETEDKYDLFLGGDCGLIDIKTDADSTDRLLVIRDSFASCLIPFLTPYFREIVAVDPDYYEGNLTEVMQDTKFTSILFLYGGNSFVTDKKLSAFLEAEQPAQTPAAPAGNTGEDGTSDGAAGTDAAAEPEDGGEDADSGGAADADSGDTGDTEDAGSADEDSGDTGDTEDTGSADEDGGDAGGAEDTGSADEDSAE